MPAFSKAAGCRAEPYGLSGALRRENMRETGRIAPERGRKMLDRQAVLRTLRSLALPREQFWVCSGAALVLHGVKKLTQDIDLGVTTQLLEKMLCQGHPFRRSVRDGTRIVDVCAGVEALENWGAFSEKLLVAGFQVETLESIRHQKALLGREKDLRDIIAIDRFLQMGKL